MLHSRVKYLKSNRDIFNIKQFYKKPTNLLGSAKRDDTHPRTTVAYNACYHLFRKRSSTPMCIWVHSYVRLERDNNTKTAICVTRRRRQIYQSPISELRAKVEWVTKRQMKQLNHPFQKALILF